MRHECRVKSIYSSQSHLTHFTQSDFIIDLQEVLPLRYPSSKWRMNVETQLFVVCKSYDCTKSLCIKSLNMGWISPHIESLHVKYAKWNSTHAGWLYARWWATNMIVHSLIFTFLIETMFKRSTAYSKHTLLYKQSEMFGTLQFYVCVHHVFLVCN